LHEAWGKMTPGSEVVYTVSRNGKNTEIAVTLAKLPEDVMAKWIGQHMLEHATVAPPEAALQKLFGSEIEQRIEELALDLQGPFAQLYRDPMQMLDPTDWQERYLYGRSVTISSGTSEIMRNLLAQRALGLPRG